jgi:hypothetical protein
MSPMQVSPSKLMITIRHRVKVVAAVPSEEAAPDEEEAAECSLLFVKVNNENHPNHTQLSIETRDYPGLHRAVAWALNGMGPGIRVQNAEVKRIASDGFAECKYWLSDLKGKKLSDRLAFDLKESLTDFIETCMPSEKEELREWRSEAGAFVSNSIHESFTELVIAGEPEDGHKAGFLLELLTVLSASGALVQQATIISSRDFAPLDDLPHLKDHNFKKGRVFRFLLSDGNEKLSPGRIQSLLFMIELVAGRGYQPTKISY